MKIWHSEHSDYINGKARDGYIENIKHGLRMVLDTRRTKYEEDKNT